MSYTNKLIVKFKGIPIWVEIDSQDIEDRDGKMFIKITEDHKIVINGKKIKPTYEKKIYMVAQQQKQKRS